ncbi:XK-related protein 5 isoform X2 [Caretta caretta]|uniref:XK-related protein 5 isoform X2 n=1 Tax=Caretta caretta TaxID=8467 RepID=UPI0020954755|nr:XK-related protein 5 isoform X2 [Caretta caretta]
MRAAFAGLSLLLLAAEQGARVCTIVHYLLSGRYLWCWLTIALLLPDYVVQILSFSWFRADGHIGCCCLVIVHMLKLGIWKRHWDALWTAAKPGGSSIAGDLLMQLGDLAVLRLLEALLQTLPHLLLQSYVFVVVEPTGLVPGVSAGLSLLSLSWSLVSYSRFTCLMKPGHLYMPAAALLCQLLWRTGMLGTRVVALVLFARVYPVWVFVAAGAHWLVMSFWLVSQQTDIIVSSCHWRLFNFLVGAVYIFCYINVQAGPSRYRVAVFYVIMLIENIFLLMLATDLLQGVRRDSLFMTGAVMAGFVIGSAALVIYYSLLHPKSTEIWQSFLKKSCSITTAKYNGTEGSTFRSINEAGESFGISAQGDIVSSNAEVSKVVHTRPASRAHSEISLGELEGHTSVKDSWVNHHHWLLVKLALKTGDVSKINAAFGDGGIGELYPSGLVASKHCSAMLGPKTNLGFSSMGKCPGTPKARVVGQRFQAEENGAGESLSRKETTYLTLASSEHNTYSVITPLTLPEEHRPTAKAPDCTGLTSRHEAQADKAGGVSAPLAPNRSANGNSDLEAIVEHPEGTAQMHESPTLYFSANAEVTASLNGGGGAASCAADGLVELVEDSRLRPVTDNTVGKGDGFPITMANISPILGVGTPGLLQSSPSFCCTHQCNALNSSEETSELTEQEGVRKAQCNHGGTTSVGTWVAAVKRRLRPAEEPCYTSTPKADPPSQDCRLGEAKERTKLTGLMEQL